MAQHLHDPIQTRASLLGRLKDWDDNPSWQEFHNAYAQLIRNVALQKGLTEGEAQDVVQETLVSVARAMPDFKYDPARCTFKTWLLHLTRRRIVDQVRKRRPDELALRSEADDGTRTDPIARFADPDRGELERLWDAEWEKAALDVALERLKRQVSDRHFQMFYLHVIKQQPVGTVARALGVNVALVYLVKHRLLPQFEKALAAVQREWI